MISSILLATAFSTAVANYITGQCVPDDGSSPNDHVSTCSPYSTSMTAAACKALCDQNVECGAASSAADVICLLSASGKGNFLSNFWCNGGQLLGPNLTPIEGVMGYTTYVANTNTPWTCYIKPDIESFSIKFGGQAWGMAKSLDNGQTWTPIATVDMHTYQHTHMVGEVRGEAQPGMMLKFQPLHTGLAQELGYHCPYMHQKCDGTCTFDEGRNFRCFNWDHARIFLHEFKIDGRVLDFSSTDVMKSQGWELDCRVPRTSCQPPIQIVNRWGESGFMVRQDGPDFYYTYTFGDTDHCQSPIYEDSTEKSNPCEQLPISTDVGASFSAFYRVKTTQTSMGCVMNFRESMNIKIQNGKSWAHLLTTTQNWSNGGGATTINDDVWHNIGVSYDGTSMEFYVNGVLDGELSKQGNVQSSGSIWYGCRSGGYEQFNGQVKDLRIFDTVLSETYFTQCTGVTGSPTNMPTGNPTINPSNMPTGNPTINPSNMPTGNPTINPSNMPTGNPTMDPTNMPTGNPTINPTNMPTSNPSKPPTAADGILLENGCPSDYPQRYPGTNRCFGYVWGNFGCNIDPKHDPTAHHAGDRRCVYSDFVYVKTSHSSVPEWMRHYLTDTIQRKVAQYTYEYVRCTKSDGSYEDFYTFVNEAQRQSFEGNNDWFIQFPGMKDMWDASGVVESSSIEIHRDEYMPNYQSCTKVVPLGGTRTGNGCPSRIPLRYPGTDRCFETMWKGEWCNVNANQNADPVCQYEEDRHLGATIVDYFTNVQCD